MVDYKDENREFIKQIIERSSVGFKPKTDYGEVVGGVLGYLYAWRWPIVILTITILLINKL